MNATGYKRWNVVQQVVCPQPMMDPWCSARGWGYYGGWGWYSQALPKSKTS